MIRIAVAAAMVLVTAACSSTQESTTPGSEIVLAVPSGPSGERFPASTPVEAARSFVGAWAAGDFPTVMAGFDDGARREISDAAWTFQVGALSRAGWFVDGELRPTEFSDFGSDLLAASLLATIDAVGASPVDFSRPLRAIEAFDADPNSVEVRFADGETVVLMMVESASGFAVRRIDPGPTSSSSGGGTGSVYAEFDPLEGTQWQGCGEDEPVVLDGVDCSVVQGGIAGLSQARQDEVAALRAAAEEDPSLSIDIAQQIQSLLAAAPGQACRFMQTERLPVGEAMERAEELAETTCPFFEPLPLHQVDYTGWRYAELALGSPEEAVESLVDAWGRADWDDVHLILSADGQRAFTRSLTNLRLDDLVADVDQLERFEDSQDVAEGGAFPAHFADWYRVVDPPLSLGSLTAEAIGEGERVVAETSTGTFSFAVEQSMSGRWRIRAIAEGGSVDPTGAVFQPAR